MNVPFDFEADGTLFEIKRPGTRGIRDIQASLMHVARYLATAPGKRAVLVLPDVRVSESRLRDEWEELKKVIRPEISKRLQVVGERDGEFFGIPAAPDAKLLKTLATERGNKALIQTEHRALKRPDRTRQADFWFFTILKILMHRLVTSSEPMRMNELATAAGCTYPTVRTVLDELGGIVERTSDRRVRLRWFPKPELARMAAVAPRVRRTARFVDRSSSPRTTGQHLLRLKRLSMSDVSVGGVIGAKRTAPDLDIVGAPRLDVSLAPNWRTVDDAAETFARMIDPALARIQDPLSPASLVVHQVPHAVDLSAWVGDLLCADVIDCLLDLYEARLDGAARDFLQVITKGQSR